MYKKIILGATAASFVAVSAWAGGLSDAIVETVPDDVAPVAAESSAPGWLIPAVIAGILIAVAVSSDDDDDPEDTTGNDQDPVGIPDMNDLPGSPDM